MFPELPRALPQDRPVALLLRHAERPPIPEGSMGMELELTPAGVAAATALGKAIGPRVRRVHTSHVRRCVQTAQALCQGGGLAHPVVQDPKLGVPSTFALQDPVAGATIRGLGFEGFMDHLLYGDQVLPGLPHPEEGARLMREHLVADLSGPPGLHVFVTHDVMIAASVVRAWKVRFSAEDWPVFLESAAVWREGDRTVFAYRERSGPAGA